MAKSKEHITDRLEDTERYWKLYTMLLNAIPSSVLLIDPHMRIISANRNFLEKSRLSEAITLTRPLQSVFPPVIIENTNIIAQIQEVFQTNQPSTGQQLHYRAPGIPIRTYYYRLLPFVWHDSIESVMILMDDITEQIQLSKEVHRIESHLTNIFQSANDIMLTTDKEGKILTWNPAGEQISGFDYNEVKDKYFYDYCAPQHHSEVVQTFSQIAKDNNSKIGEWELISKSGSIVHVSWLCSPLKDEKSQSMGIVLVGRDLSEKRKLERQLLQSQKFAALGVMAGGIAHEIRNPLAICFSAAQFLMDDDLSPDFHKECVTKINSSITRASRVIESLLSYARPSMNTKIKTLDVVDLMQTALNLITNQAALQNIKIERKFPGSAIWVRGNVDLLQQVFINLFLNGIQAMPRGGILSITIVPTDGRILTRIKDTGKGISPEDMGNIFDPFYTTLPVGKGTGLGLSLCYAIIQQHAGTVEVESMPGKGSTFTVQLPAVPKDDDN